MSVQRREARQGSNECLVLGLTAHTYSEALFDAPRYRCEDGRHSLRICSPFFALRTPDDHSLFLLSRFAAWIGLN